MTTTEAAQSSAHKREKGAILLRVIGAFKVIKAILLILIAMAALHMINKDTGETIRNFAHEYLHIAPGNRQIEKLAAKSLSITRRKLELAATIFMIYAAMFATEGMGLIFEQKWAEWMTVITTAGLIPFEIYEIVEKPNWLKVLALVINVVVAIYLAARVRRETREKHEKMSERTNTV